MGALAPAIPVISAVAGIGGTLLSARAAQNAGTAEQQALNYQAQQMQVNAGQERAAAQRRAIDEIKRKDLAQSRAQAVAAASGGGALDPTVMDIMGDLEGEGQYNANVATYEGEERARDLEGGATLKRYEGKQAKRAGNLKAVTTLVSGGSSLLDKYG